MRAPRTLAACFAFALIALIALQLSGIAQALNVAVYNSLYSPDSTLQTFAQSITHFGDPALVSLLAIILSTTGYLAFKRKDSLVMGATIIACQITNAGLKNIFEVPRPEYGQHLLHSFSFPSGHASGSVALYGVMAVWLLQGHLRATRHLGYLIAAIPALIVVISRPVIGVHWPLDVITGAVEGVLFASLFKCWLDTKRAVTLPLRPLVWLIVAIALSYTLIRNYLF